MSESDEKIRREKRLGDFLDRMFSSADSAFDRVFALFDDSFGRLPSDDAEPTQPETPVFVDPPIVTEVDLDWEKSIPARDGVPDGWGTPSMDRRTLVWQYIEAARKADALERAISQFPDWVDDLVRKPQSDELLLLALTPFLRVVDEKVAALDPDCPSCIVSLDQNDINLFVAWKRRVAAAGNAMRTALLHLGS